MPKGKADLSEAVFSAAKRAYRSERTQLIEDCHNEITTLFGRHELDVESILYLLELLRYEVLRARYEQVFGTR